MGKVFSLVVGFTLGAVIGTALMMLFAPSSGENFTHNLKRGWNETMSDARQASIQRRTELEAQLQTMRK